jgi:DNA-binding NtrC family response regulator
MPARRTTAKPATPDDGGPPTVLVVARDGEARRRVTRAILPDFLARELAPEELAETALLVDAVATVVVLGGGWGEEQRAALAVLHASRASRALVLLAGELPEADLERAIQQLNPYAALPFPPREAELKLALRRALPARNPSQGARVQQRRATALLGVSAAIREVLAQVKHFARTRIPILILGETGTGKELVARAIHEQSDRVSAPFVAINCGALPETLLEAELFGSTKGAFTGAERDHSGLFEQADGGTLFLDEIGDTSLAVQVKLLRVLESQEVRALGANEPRSVDVRIVSATHRDLETAVKEGEFREDLLYRINAATVHVPPLRRRRVDIPFLAQHFAEEFGDAHARRILLDEGFFEALSRYDFPGNVRELRNAVERALALARPDSPLTAGDLKLGGASAAGARAPRTGTLRERVEQVEFEAIQEALARFDGNRTRTAEALGLSRLGLRQKMRRLGLDDAPSR